MEIKSLQDIQSHVGKVHYKGTEEKGDYTKTVYMCAPRKRREEGFNYLFVLKGKIVFSTNAQSRETGCYYFEIENKEVLPKVGSKSVCTINTRLAEITSEELCTKYPDKYVPSKLYMDRKKVFTTASEANAYIKKVQDGKVKLDYIPITVRTYSYKNGKEKLESEKII